MATSSPQTFGTSFDAFLQAAAAALAAGTAVPGSTGSGQPGPLQPATQAYDLPPPPRRTQVEEMDERFEKLTKAMGTWTAQFEERIKDLIVAKANGPPAAARIRGDR